MRRSTIGSALLGSAALAALLTPGAQADDVVGNLDLGTFKITGGGGSGNDVVLGITEHRTITVKLTASDDSGIKSADFTLYHGSTLAKADAKLKATETTAPCSSPTSTGITTPTCLSEPRRRTTATTPYGACAAPRRA